MKASLWRIFFNTFDQQGRMPVDLSMIEMRAPTAADAISMFGARKPVIDGTKLEMVRIDWVGFVEP